jgi:hypothetical protein
MPDTALNYTDRLIQFGFDLGKNYNAYSICKNQKLAKQNLHCATSNKKWVFTFTIGERNIVIHDILWGPSIH